ncbi:UNVERIFIED_CONTAM: hypothetical protein GTU68_014746 [Idotea baltica]|nr:hypothetical protein [Idotea baltica]
MTPKRIHALPLHLANQIAAGEVIERPASVLKELIENSLDAGATDIIVHIEGAGSKLIRVQDNGHGIHPDDLALALSRHATSKLSSTEQLSQISSLGFRGEALPSISSISQLTLSSKQASNEHAWQYQAHNEVLLPTTHPEGTTIEVRDLFFNMPARRHFLKGDKTELNHILTTLNRLALSQFDTAFSGTFAHSNDLKLPAAKTSEQRQQRIAKICGKPFLNHSLYITQTFDDIELQGWIASDEGHRPQTDVQYFFINGRVIRDRLINHAIRQAYVNRIPEGRYPAFVLYLTMPLDRIDINVHPTKHEVRFRDGRLIHGLINKAIQEALSEQNDLSNVGQQSIETQTTLPSSANPPESSSKLTHISEAKTHYTQHVIKESNQSHSSFGAALALLEQRYLLTQKNGQHALLDIQFAEKQLRQQQFQQAIKTGTLSTRPILVPIKLSLPTSTLTQFKQCQSALKQFGFDYALTTQHLHIKTIPSLFAPCSLPQLFEDLAAKISLNSTGIEFVSLLQALLPTNTILTLEHASEILTQLDPLSIAPEWHCELNGDRLQNLFKPLKTP